MLAEPRRKVNWALNPRGTLWSSDSSKFGQKMLERMGWSEGKGLGLKEDGVRDHIRVSYKCDNRGLGFNEKQDVFDFGHEYEEVLSKLSETHANVGNSSSGHPTKPNKKPKTRHRYHKMVRAKDVERYSKKDIASIFAKSVKPGDADITDRQMLLFEGHATQTMTDNSDSRPGFGYNSRAFEINNVEESSRESERGDCEEKERENVGTSIGNKMKKKRKDPETSIADESTSEATADSLQGEEIVTKKERKRRRKEELPSDEVEVEGETKKRRKKRRDAKNKEATPEKASFPGEDLPTVEEIKPQVVRSEKIHGGYAVNGNKVSEALFRGSEIAVLIEKCPSLATSSLLNIKGYGSGV